MAFKRRGTYRKRNSRKITPALKSAIKTVANRVINRRAELKHFPSSLQVSCSTTVSLNNLSTNSQGTTDLTHIGDQIELKSLDLYYQIVYNDNSNIVRVTFIQWYPTSTPTAGDIFADTSAYGVNLGNFAQDSVRAKLFKVLYDDVHAVSTSKMNIVKKLSLKNFRKNLAFFSATTTAGGHIYCILSSDSSAVGHPAFFMNYGMAYYDI